jgi:prepilin-type N-terminal cleavage/methylation domain-containing protein
MNKKGFTLVELLIVIALLGVLATAVLAAINPLEQANRARDSRVKSDSSQLLAAIDRYYVAIGHFPWYEAGVQTDEDALNFTDAQDITIGICAVAPGTSGCLANPGSLITNNELKTEFTKRDFIKSTTDAKDRIYVGKGDGTTGVAASTYACFVPKSKSEQKKATRTITLADSVITEGVADCATRTYADLATSCVVCLPE